MPPQASQCRHRLAEAAIDISNFGHDAAGQVAEQKRGDIADFFGGHVAADGRVGGDSAQNFFVACVASVWHLVELQHCGIQVIPDLSTRSVRHSLRLESCRLVKTCCMHGEQFRHGSKQQVNR